jgi:hypothetical protein
VQPTSAQFSLTLRVRIDHRPGMLGRVATAIGQAGGTIGDVELVEFDRRHTLRDMTVDAGDEEHERRIVDAVRAVDGAQVVDWTDRTLGMHVGGKLEVALRHPLRTADDLSMAYTPGVARVCGAIVATVKSIAPGFGGINLGIPSAIDRAVAPAVAGAVAREARRSGWAEAGAGEFGYAEGETGEFRAVRS